MDVLKLIHFDKDFQVSLLLHKFETKINQWIQYNSSKRSLGIILFIIKNILRVQRILFTINHTLQFRVLNSKMTAFMG